MLEYLLVFPDQDTAATVAEELREDEEFGHVRVVRDPLAGEDDAADPDWAVYVRVDTLDDESSAAAQALHERFTELARENGGWMETDLGEDYSGTQ